MNVSISNIEDLDFSDSEAVQLLNASIQHTSRFISANNVSATIWVNKRIPETEPSHRHPGWLEFSICIFNREKCVFQMGAIQRKPKEKFEFHS